MGIEPTWPAWKAGVLPLNYARKGAENRAVIYPLRADVNPEFLNSCYSGTVFPARRLAGGNSDKKYGDQCSPGTCTETW